MTPNPAEAVARAVAVRLSAPARPALPAQVDAALRSARPDQYSDAVDIASLIVSIASLGYTIYTDQRNRRRPSAEMLARSIRQELAADGDGRLADEVIETVADEIMKNPPS